MSLELGHPIRHHLFRMRYTELNEIYWFMVCRSFALSLVGIFIPIYLYKLNFGISNIFLYYVFLYLFEFLFEYLAAGYIKRRGPKHSMIISLPFMVIHLGQLLTLQYFSWSPFLLAISLSISLAFFWEGYHYDFSRSKHTKRATREVGKTLVSLTLIGATAPLIGGLVATYAGMNVLLTAVIILFFLGSLILLKTRDTNFRKGKLDLSRLDFKKLDAHLVSYAGLGWQSVAANQIWPLFLFLIVGTYSGIGLITSLTIFVSIAVISWVSRRADKGKRVSFLRMGGWAATIVGILHIFVDTVSQAFAINITRALAESLFKPSFDSEYYLHADEESRSEYIYVMEVAVDLSRLIFHVILYILSLSFALPIVLVAGLLMGAFGSSLISLMPAAKCEICGEIENQQIKVARRLNA